MPNTRNPMALIARHWQPSARLVERAALATVVMSVVIIVTGGAVRLTDSGLGCPTWPRCTPQSLTPTGVMSMHTVIEFGNRMLTYVMCAAVGLAILAARARSPWRRDLTRLGWAQFWLVFSNAVLGGIVVLTGLNPYIVGAHFLVSMVLLTVAVLMWRRSTEGAGPARPVVSLPVRQLCWLLAVATAALLLVGMVVTGAGPHAGDARKVHRIPLDWENVTHLHVDLVMVVFGLAIGLFFALGGTIARRPPTPTGAIPDPMLEDAGGSVTGGEGAAPSAGGIQERGLGAAPRDARSVARRRVVHLIVVLLAQGLIGAVQYLTHLPELIVGAHLLGAALVWIAVLRVLVALRMRALPTTEAGELTSGRIEVRDASLSRV